MPNKYFSQEIRLLSRGLYKKIITPPNNYFITQSSDYRGLFYPRAGTINMTANALIKSVGLFCNLADGLAFASNAQPVTLSVSIHGFPSSGSALPGTASSVGQMDAMLGIGTLYTFNLAPDDYIQGLTSGFIYKVKSVINDNNIDIYGTYVYPFSGERFQKLSLLGSLYQWGFVQINTLNEMYPITFPSLQNLYAPTPAIKQFAIEMSMDLPSTSGVTFFTKSIDTSYAGLLATFDGAIDFEFTSL
jgi:hypothetical protein